MEIKYINLSVCFFKNLEKVQNVKVSGGDGGRAGAAMLGSASSVRIIQRPWSSRRLTGGAGDVNNPLKIKNKGTQLDLFSPTVPFLEFPGLNP